MNRKLFLTHYRAELTARYGWAQDVAKLDRFMTSCETTIASTAATWNHDGDAVTAAWRSIGGKGKPSLKALRALEA